MVSEQADVVADNLHQVLVAGDHRDLEAFGGIAARQGGNDIVRLKPGRVQGRDIEGLQDLPDVGDLGCQILGHGLPVRLVFGIDVPAEGFLPWPVEDHGQIIGVVLLHEPQQHPGETINGIGRYAAGGDNIADAVVGAVDVTGTVE